MSNTGLIIEERSRDIGDFLVGRLLPFRKKRMVGPFTFIDHMGPSKIGPVRYLDVDQHPHIGLSTLTYLFEGEIMHRDSIGSEQLITPGSVNLMTAGKGVVHTERTPENRRNGQEMTMHGYQIWIALPKELEDMAPKFHHIPKDQLPAWSKGGIDFTLVAGKGYGRTSPVPVYSELFMVELKTSKQTAFSIEDDLHGEIGIVVEDGSIDACGETIEKGNMLVSKTEDTCNITINANTHLLLFGGQPFPEERFMNWNFVSSDKDKLEAARQRWIDKDFEMVANDNTYVPIPGRDR